LSSIDGDGHFVDDKFVTVPPSTDHQSTAAAGKAAGAVGNLSCDPNSSSGPALVGPSQQQIDSDHQLAMTLYEEDEKLLQRETAWEEYKAKTTQGVQLTDEELAQKLQAEENLAAEQQQQQQLQRDYQASSASSQLGADGGGGFAQAGQTVARQERPAGAVAGSRQSGPNQRAKNCIIL